MKPPDKPIPRMLGRYHVLDAIERDGWSTAHLARMEGPAGFQRWVTLRRVHPELSGNAAFKDSFYDAARAAARIVHPNVAATVDVGETDGFLWVAEEHLFGETVAAVVAEVRRLQIPVPWDIACRIVADAALGVDALHEARDKRGKPIRRTHGAISANHVVVTYDGKTKITDCARPAALGTSASAEDERVLPYTAPEVLFGDAVDPRADQFGLGVMLWELSAGRRLFQGGDPDETRALLEAHVVPELRDIVRSYPAIVESIVHRAMAREPGRRFPDARALARALQAALVKEALLVTDDDVGRYMVSLFDRTYREKQAKLESASDVTEVFMRDVGVKETAGEDSYGESGPTNVFVRGDLGTSGETRVLPRSDDDDGEDAHTRLAPPRPPTGDASTAPTTVPVPMPIGVRTVRAAPPGAIVAPPPSGSSMSSMPTPASAPPPSSEAATMTLPRLVEDDDDGTGESETHVLAPPLPVQVAPAPPSPSPAFAPKSPIASAPPRPSPTPAPSPAAAPKPAASRAPAAVPRPSPSASPPAPQLALPPVPKPPAPVVNAAAFARTELPPEERKAAPSPRDEEALLARMDARAMPSEPPSAGQPLPRPHVPTPEPLRAPPYVPAAMLAPGPGHAPTQAPAFGSSGFGRASASAPPPQGHASGPPPQYGSAPPGQFHPNASPQQYPSNGPPPQYASNGPQQYPSNGPQQQYRSNAPPAPFPSNAPPQQFPSNPPPNLFQPNAPPYAGAPVPGYTPSPAPAFAPLPTARPTPLGAFPMSPRPTPVPPPMATMRGNTGATVQTRNVGDATRPILVAALVLSLIAVAGIIAFRLHGHPETATVSETTPAIPLTPPATTSTPPPPPTTLPTGLITGPDTTQAAAAGGAAGAATDTAPPATTTATPPPPTTAPTTSPAPTARTAPATTRSSSSSGGAATPAATAPKPPPAPSSPPPPPRHREPPPPRAETPPPPDTDNGPPPSAGAATGGGRGQLTIVCVPACDEVLDGRTSLGPSPIFKRSVPAGPHHLTLKSSDPPGEKGVDVVVRPDDVTVVRQSL